MALSNDPPVTPFSSPEKIRAWTEELNAMLADPKWTLKERSTIESAPKEAQWFLNPDQTKES